MHRIGRGKCYQQYVHDASSVWEGGNTSLVTRLISTLPTWYTLSQKQILLPYEEHEDIYNHHQSTAYTATAWEVGKLPEARSRVGG